MNVRDATLPCSGLMVRKLSSALVLFVAMSTSRAENQLSRQTMNVIQGSDGTVFLGDQHKAISCLALHNHGSKHLTVVRLNDV